MSEGGEVVGDAVGGGVLENWSLESLLCVRVVVVLLLRAHFACIGHRLEEDLASVDHRVLSYDLPDAILVPVCRLTESFLNNSVLASEILEFIDNETIQPQIKVHPNRPYYCPGLPGPGLYIANKVSDTFL